jgi:hypothetical protein
MSHLTALNPGNAGDTASTTDISLPSFPTTGKAQNVCVYASPNNSTAAAVCTQTNPLYTAPTDGTNTILSGSAANLSGFLSIHAALSVEPGNWAITNVPAAATQATISKAAGGAGVRHVCTSIAATFSTAGTAQATALVLNLRDGATGAGTVLWSKQVVLNTNSVWDVNISGLNIVGSANTAMTLEFAAAGVAASFESVALTGFDCS